VDGVVDFLRRHRDLLWKIAVGACVLALLYPLVQAYYLWIASESAYENHPGRSFWILAGYLFDPLLGAIVLGAIVQQWRAVYVGLVGLVAQLILVTGTIITDDPAVGPLRLIRGTGDEIGISTFQIDLQAYLTSTLQWIWIIGLIAFGVAIGRKIGDLFAELKESPDAPPPPPVA
jgi:hypothetical protein